jgi:ubiquinone/menaquinone biosynthesis C-methylase UbiE
MRGVIHIHPIADAIFVAQAFHWMANVDTLREMYRVLKPTGQLFLVWNTLDSTIPWLHGIFLSFLPVFYFLFSFR